MQKEMENIKNKQELPYLQSKYLQHLFREVFLKSWWALLFVFLCSILYTKAFSYKIEEQKKLQEKRTTIEKEIEQTIVQQKDLHLQIISQEDPAFIELTLIRCLGLVPQGYTKIHFIQEPR